MSQARTHTRPGGGRFRYYLTLAALLVASMVLLGLLGLVWLDSERGHRWLSQEISRALVDKGIDLELERVEGSLFSDFRIHGLTLSDKEGEWFRLENGLVMWSPLELMNGKLIIGRVDAKGLHLARLPVAPPQSSTSTKPTPWLPDSIQIQQGTVSGTIMSIPFGVALMDIMLAETGAKGRFEFRSGATDKLDLIIRQAAREPVAITGEISLEEGNVIGGLAGLPADSKLAGRFDVFVDRDSNREQFLVSWRSMFDQARLAGSKISGLDFTGQASGPAKNISGDFQLKVKRLLAAEKILEDASAAAHFAAGPDASWQIQNATIDTALLVMNDLSLSGNAGSIDFAAGELAVTDKGARLFAGQKSPLTGLKSGFTIKRGETDRYNVTASGHANFAGKFAEPYVPVLGEAPSFVFNADVTDDLRLILHSANTKLPIGDLSVSGEALLSESTGDVTAILELSPQAVDRHTGSALSGRITLQAGIRGDFTAPAITLTNMPIEFRGYGIELNELKASLHLAPRSSPDPTWLGALDITAISGNETLQVSSAISARASGVQFENFVVETPLLAAMGNVDYQFDSGISGGLQLARSLAQLEQASTNAEGLVVAYFSTDRDLASPSVSVRGEKLSFETREGFPLTIGRLEARLTDTGERSSWQSGLLLEDMAVGARSLKRLEILPLADGIETWALRSEGIWPVPLSTDLQIERKQNAMEITGMATVGNVDVKVGSPLTVAFDEGVGFEVENALVGTGSVSLSAKLADGKLAGLVASARGFDASMVNMLQPGLVDTANFDLDANLGESAGLLQGKLLVNGNAITVPTGHAIGDVSTYSTSLDVTFGPEGLHLTGSATEDTNEIGNLVANIPLLVPAKIDQLIVDQQEPVHFRFVWKGDVEPVWALLQRPRHSLSGQLNGVLEVAGTLETPVISGSLSVQSGRYEYIPLGLTADISAFELRGNNQWLSLDLFEATDGNSGRLSASGAFRLTADQQIQGGLDLNMAGFQIARLPTFASIADAILSWHLDPGFSRLSGNIEARKLDILLPKKLPVTIEEVAVTEINGRAPTADIPQTPGEFGLDSGPPTELDLKIQMPGQSFVEGYGLKSEWRGELAVQGTTLEPRVVGQLDLIRGSYTLGPRQFNLAQGKLTLDGNPNPDPLVSLQAVHETPFMTANLDISGRASAPSFSFSSIPDMPQDEILARILIGKSSAELNAWQIAELGSMVASLKGGSGDPISKIRRTLGLDKLSVGKNESLDGQTMLTGGKYLRRNIFLEIETALAGNTAASRVRFDLTRRLQLETEAGPLKGNSLFLKWFWDY